ncbi:LANO_0E14642g1_1 [Lachancea nothofagi CBS 11611]|uniref:histone acetyltransferase n=1 Tax=Lachancea nothofagi CBS 11611 TaxID=1266666 RepID=A0A1G4K0G3_9SACH|nr:LANO_0E14642g1_1 [Lachancea nothofagi CBS 11611]
MCLLQELLSHALPDTIEFELLHLQSPPRETHPIVLKRHQTTAVNNVIKSQHFFVLCSNKKVFYALEIYVYVTVKLSEVVDKLVFVSKADTNGYCDHNVSIKELTRVLLEYVLSIDPLHYLSKVLKLSKPQRDYTKAITQHTTTRRALRILKNRVSICQRYTPPTELLFSRFDRISPQWSCRLCLFTRSEPQYLFSESSQNPKKHVLPGNLLLKWWLSVVDQAITDKFDSFAHARIQIPGEETSVIDKYLRNCKSPNWEVGDIFNGEREDLAIFRLPVLPDDPKGRFLEQLVDEGRAKKVHLTDFWTELQIQQEFRLGATVSVIGVDGNLKPFTSHPARDNEIISPGSKKLFNMIKCYITGEEYDTEEGAFDAYANITDFLRLRFNRTLTCIQGKKISKRVVSNLLPSSGLNNQPLPFEAQTLSTTLVRKRPKK